MKPVVKSTDSARLGFIRSILEDAGIRTHLQNEYSHNVLAPVPLDLFQPALCVVNDDDYEKAISLIRETTMPQMPTAAEWSCPRCGEKVPGNFEMCWKCNAGQPG